LRYSEMAKIGADGRHGPAVGCTSAQETSADGGGGTGQTGNT